MPLLLHVGCGQKTKLQSTPVFRSSDWGELRVDIDPAVRPDVVGTMTDMAGVASASADALFSSHNIEHLYPHEVPVALREFRRVLKPTGYAVVTCPDLQSVCALIASNKLLEPAYVSPSGPIAPLDILYGHRPAMAAGNLFMAHRCGFTRDVLAGTLKSAGFGAAIAVARPKAFDLWALATMQEWPQERLRELLLQHLGSPPAVPAKTQ